MADKDRHIFLLIGQSNMAGRAPIEEADKLPVPGAFLWNVGAERWEPALPPYNRYSPSRKGIDEQHLNPGPTFARAYLKANPEAEIGMICSCRGATRIGQWVKDDPDPFDLYRHAVDAVKLAVEEDGCVLKGILWHQGESNVQNADEYPEKLARLVRNLRADLGKNIPVVFGQIGQWNADHAAFNKMIVGQVKNISKSAVVATDRLKNMDVFHFDTAAQRLLGKRYAAKMLELLKKE